MPLYDYEHEDDGCELGKVFERKQSVKEPSLSVCPKCNHPVRRLISIPYINTPMSDTDLKSKGFTKLVRRDKGVYENVTALDHESRYFKEGHPETLPDLKRKIGD